MKDQVIENMSEVCHEEWMGWSKDISKELYVVVDVLKKDIEYFREMPLIWFKNLNPVLRDGKACGFLMMSLPKK